ncbi:MAG: cupin domain-containing protein [Acidobacteria bacterium]|nr:cupin domain-containing protein [Acidobacteriota bacterium]
MVWRQHQAGDELFLVVQGRFRMEFRDRDVWLEEGEFLIVPRGVEHRPVALEAHRQARASSTGFETADGKSGFDPRSSAFICGCSACTASTNAGSDAGGRAR